MKFEEFQGNFAEAVSYLEADLGGTELEQAIVSCMNLFPGRNKQSAMLLLTDGEVWDSCKPMIWAALEAKRRIFILGIGMAPYNNLLVELAEKTGGAYEAVYNWYDIEGAVENAFGQKLQYSLRFIGELLNFGHLRKASLSSLRIITLASLF